jgi:benzoyl-CoA reductase/2-hydroxyglutaryl-CoA dehydratase subunit BcrC/BadD/HgdB
MPASKTDSKRRSRAKPRPAATAPEPAASPALQELRELARSYSFSDVEQAVANGRQAIWGGTGWELPLIYACDTIPAGEAEFWREGSHESEAIAESEYQVPGEFCSMVKAMIGKLRQRSKNEKIRRILCFGSACEPFNIVFEMARREGYEIHTIEAVTTFRLADQRPEVIQFLISELRKVALWLTGKEVDEERLRQEIRRKNLLSAKVRRIMDLRLNNPLYMGSSSVLQLMDGYFHYFGDPARFERILDDLAQELKAAAPYHAPDSYIPLVLAGSFVGSPALFDVVESSRGAFVGWEIFGTRDYREDLPPLESLAHYLLDAQLLGMYGEGAGSAVHLRKVNIEALLKKTGAKGVVSASVTSCPYGSLVPQLERQHFKACGIPYINLETTVHLDPPTEEQITRLKTFVEMLSDA